jgi:hypothetical protein
VPQPYRGKTVSFDDWFSFEAVAKRSFFTRLDFHRLYQIYAGAFGADRVHVMTFEELVVKPMAYAAALATLLGVDPDEMSKLIVTKPAKPRPSEVATKYRALRQRLLPNISLAQLPGGATVRRALHKFIETAPPLTVVLKPAQRDIICARFGPSNRLLAAATQIDLTALDYPMTPDPAPTRMETAFAAPVSGGRA